MYVGKVKLDSIRGFHGARRVDLDLLRPDQDAHAGWTVLVGPNGSGKTTLLRAIAVALAGPVHAGALIGDITSWISSGQERGGIEVDLTGDIYVGLTIGADGIEMEGKVASLRGGFFIGYGPHKRTSSHGTLLTGLFREDPPPSDAMQWLIAQHLGAQERRAGAAEARDSALAMLRDGLLPEGMRIAGLDAQGLWVVQGENRLPLRELGGGIRTTVAMVVDLFRHLYAVHGRLPMHPDRPAIIAPAVVLIDEVEAHLHPNWQQSIGFWFKEHFPGTQFIVATNSPFIAQAADPHGLIRLPGPFEQAAPHVVGEDLYRRVVFGGAEDVLLSDLFALESPYSSQARRLREELVELELRVLDGQASEIQLARYRELQELLVSSPAARAQEIEARLARARRGKR